MTLIIICIIYAIPTMGLFFLMIKNFLKMKQNNTNSHMYRQYFLTSLIMLCLLIISFIAVVLKLLPNGVLVDPNGTTATIGYNATESFDFFKYLKYMIALILIITAIFLFDWYVIKRTAKNTVEYHRRRLLFGVILIIISIATIIGLVLR